MTRRFLINEFFYFADKLLVTAARWKWLQSSWSAIQWIRKRYWYRTNSHVVWSTWIWLVFGV